MNIAKLLKLDNYYYAVVDLNAGSSNNMAFTVLYGKTSATEIESVELVIDFYNQGLIDGAKQERIKAIKRK